MYCTFELDCSFSASIFGGTAPLVWRELRLEVAVWTSPVLVAVYAGDTGPIYDRRLRTAILGGNG